MQVAGMQMAGENVVARRTCHLQTCILANLLGDLCDFA